MLEPSEEARQHAEAYGINLEWIQEATPPKPGEGLGLEAPWGARYSLYVRGPTTWEDFPLVAIVDAGGTVQGVHVVPEELSDRRPLKMLRALAGRHGLRTSVWGHEGHYFPPVDMGTPRRPVEGAEGVELLEDASRPAVQDLTRFSEDDGLQLFMAFAVDATAVREAVGLGE